MTYTCATNAREQYDMFFPVQCPKGCASRTYGVWGNGVYTRDSSICRAAIHDGPPTVLIKQTKTYPLSWCHSEFNTTLTCHLMGHRDYYVVIYVRFCVVAPTGSYYFKLTSVEHSDPQTVQSFLLRKT